ncbi:MAG: flagellar biosynthesis protein FlhA, partial [Planctomycetota bacterium]
NPVIGMIIFMVIVVVQFVVLTKGATRVSEVAARFQLDSMPGKQMSIDGDLAAGLISQESARERRQEVADEADFYGAMDGASKFVRGDAIAGLVIVTINVLGGIIVGIAYHGMNVVEAINVFSKLTIGDGLVSQVPALMVSIASALLVTRSAASEHLGKDLGRQVFANHHVLYVAAAFLVLLLPSGLPVGALVVGAIACGVSGFLLQRERAGANSELEAMEASSAVELPSTPTRPRKNVERSTRVDPLAIEVGYRLLALVDDERGAELIHQISDLRASIASELGLVLPPIEVRDSRSLKPSQYSIELRGHSLGRWTTDPSGILVVSKRPDSAFRGPMPGPEIDGMKSFWCGEDDALPNDMQAFEFLGPSRAIARHLDQVIRANTAEILTREEVSRMLVDLKRHSPNLVEDLIPRVLDVSDLHRVLQGLLREGVSIRDLESILETLGSSPRHATVEDGVAEVRRALARGVTAAALGPDGKLNVVLFDPALEEFLSNSIDTAAGEPDLHLDPQTSDAVSDRTTTALVGMQDAGLRPVVLCSSRLRSHVWQMIRRRMPRVIVLSYDEVIEDDTVEVHGSVVLETIPASPGMES